VALILLATPSQCHAQATLRIATLAPDGTMWAHILRDWSRTVESQSKGAVAIKLYFGGLAGDELEVAGRIRRGQLDGLISAGTMCQQVAPSLRVMKVVGLFQDREEAAHVMTYLKPIADKEALANGFINVAEAALGSIIIFSRAPIATLSDLRAATVWTGRQDDFTVAQLKALGLHAVPMPLDEAGTAFAQGKIDGFLTVPATALSWQWSTLAHNYTDLRLSLLFGCLLIANTGFDGLSLETQSLVRSAAIQAVMHLEQIGRQQDDALVNGLFEKQGLKRVTVDSRLRSEFFEAASAARDHIDPKDISPALLQSVLSLLADYRGRRP
jgi:TRAP-type C4-dicarboxylate transport system substrate-binding protein